MNLHDVEKFLDVFFRGGGIAGRGLLGESCGGYEKYDCEANGMTFHKGPIDQ
jgi:hypothetical protein